MPTVYVPQPTGGQPFQAGPAAVSASFTLAYYDSSYYDLLTLTVPVNKTITLTDTDLRWVFNPGSITVRAATAKGAVVPYTTPIAEDPDDGAAFIISLCNHPSGSLFKVGTTNVTCKATDSEDKPKTVTAKFQVVVKGPVKTGAQGMAFWLKKTSQAIISGGTSTSGVCNSGTWLLQYAPFQDLSASAICSQVASYVTSVLNAASGTTAPLAAILKGQMLATALDVYFSDATLGGNQLSAPTPIGGVTIDLTYICTAPATSGTPNCNGTYESTSSAFSAAALPISAMLGALSSQYTSGTWYGGNQTEMGLASDALAAINLRWAFAP